MGASGITFEGRLGCVVLVSGGFKNFEVVTCCVDWDLLRFACVNAVGGVWKDLLDMFASLLVLEMS